MAELHTSFKFSSVVVIDSLKSGEDPQTGLWLRDHVLHPLAASSGVHVAYCRIENRADLLAALSSVEVAVREGGLAPILHFESHGVEQGMVLANDEVVSWPDLKPWLTAINRSSRMNLLSIMSMCHGWHLYSQLQPVDVAPVWALIGPIHPVFPARLQEAFGAFYPTLLNALDGRVAVEAMNVGRVGTTSELHIETAELTFCKVWRLYEKDACNVDELQKREGRVVENLMRQSGYDLRSVLLGRSMVRDWLAQNEQLFARYRRSFLMLDSFPENEPRFQLTYAQCVETV